MRKLSLFILGLLLPLLASAGPVTEQQALLKAQEFFASRTAAARGLGQGKTFVPAHPQNKAGITESKADGAKPYYVFNALEGGYAVVSGDDRTPAILGYSEHGRLNIDGLPDDIMAWLDSYASQIEWMEAHNYRTPIRKTVSGTAISPLLGQIEWGQDTPYNDLCPQINGTRCITGCVATAMAQIMFYHQWPAQTTKTIPSYTARTANNTVNAIPVGSIDWSNMLPSYSPWGQETTAQKQAVAALMQKCGSALKMDYGVEASGAYVSDVATALKDYFDYDSSTQYIQHSDYGLARWNQRIYDELAEGRPVLYGGQSTTKGGHAFVVDGYDKDDYFHVNWGWRGDSNGFFLLSLLDPYKNGNGEADGYNNNQEAVIGIQKNTGQAPEESHDGETFTAKTVEGVEMTFTIVSTKDKTCQVGTGKWNEAAVSQTVEGSVTIPSMADGYHVISLSDHAFYKCESMASITIPSSVETIGYYTFAYCNSLESISIPASVTSIDDYAFGNSAKMKRYEVDSDNPVFAARNGMLITKNGRYLLSYPSGLTGEFTIPSDIPNVNNGAFSGCSLTKLTFPETVTWVGGWVATGCSNLTTLIWHAKAELPTCAFRYNRQLKNIELCEGLRAIPSECFEGSRIVSIDLPTTVASIGESAFYGCDLLERISFTTKVSRFPVNNNSFYHCNSLKDIIITFNSHDMFHETLPDGTFPESVFQNATLHVPTGSADFFHTTDGWKRFQNVVEEGDPIPEEPKAEGDVWGYFAGEKPMQAIAFGGVQTTDVAIFIPGDETMVGAQITAIRIPAGSNNDLSIYEQGTAWLAESLEGDVKVREVQMQDMKEWDYTEFILSEPYTITEKGVYVGFSCPGNVFICYVNEESQPGGGWWKSYDGSWYNYSNAYRFVIQARVKGHHLPTISAHATETERNITYPGVAANIPFTLYNDGLASINSIDYTLLVDGKKEQHHLDLSVDAGISQRKTIDIEITGPAQPNKTYNVTLTIDKVNGQNNTSPQKALTQQFQNLSRQVVRRTVMEEGTGTWCTYCPRGMAAMQEAKDKYGDRFIGIAVHSSYSNTSGIDPMDIGSYGMSFYSFPSCEIDRSGMQFDPYLDTFSPNAKINILDAALQMATDVDVTVKGVWNVDMTKVYATSEAEFLGNGQNYSVVYALVADGVKGSGQNWNQSNYYSGLHSYDVDPYMKPYTDAPDPITDMTFNDVLIGSSYENTWRNMASPYSGTFTPGCKKTNSYTLSLPTEGELAQAIDKEQVYVVAMVLNADGTIANAAKAKVIVEDHIRGDLNGDNEVDGMDLVALVNVIMGQSAQSSAADLNGDGEVDGMDYVALVNIIMGTANSRSTHAAEEAHIINIGMEPLSIMPGESQKLSITLQNADMAVTMAQMDMTLPQGLTLEGGYSLTSRTTEHNHQLYMSQIGEGQHRLMLASPRNATLTGTEGAVIQLTLTADDSFEGGDIILNNILCASPDQQAARQQQAVLHLSGTNGIADLENMRNGNHEKIYTLSGQQLTAPRKGVNIIGGKKRVVK